MNEVKKRKKAVLAAVHYLFNKKPHVIFYLVGSEIKLNTRNYSLFLTMEQLKVLNSAVDLFSKINAGQFDTILNHLQVSAGAKNEIRYLLDLAAQKVNNLPMGSSFGLLSEEVPDAARIAYDLHQVMRFRLWMDCNPILSAKSVDSEPPRKTAYSASPLAFIRRFGPSEGKE